MKKTKWIVGLSIAGVVALSGTAFALTSGPVVKSVGQTLGFDQTVTTTQIQETIPQPSALALSSINDNLGGANTPGSNRYGGGYGMMGDYGGGYGMMGGYGGGYGMMGDYGGGYGMMGGYCGGYGMMGGYGANGYGVAPTDSVVVTSDQAIAIAKDYTKKLDQDVAVAELHEFATGYEVELKEGATGAKAYEIMVYKNGRPEIGPKIMWNTKYGYSNWGNNGTVTVSEEQATKSAQKFVANMGQEYSIRNPELAPGYYEFMIQKDGKDYAELDVNGYTGQVWLQNWQGPILNTIDVK